MSTNGFLIVQRQKVREAFGKSDKDIEKDIEIIREWIKMQPHFPEMPNDNMIEYFLVTNKFSIERLKSKLDMYYTIRSLIPDLYQNKHLRLPHMQATANMNLACPLPKLTKELYRVHIIRINGDLDDFDVYNLFGYLLNMIEVKVQEDLVMGDVFVFDHTCLKIGHVTKMTPMSVKKIATVMEKVFSNRIKGIHTINYPTYVDMLVNIVKAVLKPKLVKRIYLHPNVEDLYQYVPKDILPSDYGGEERSLKELSDSWKLHMDKYSDRFDELEKMKVREELRPEPLKNDDVLGFHGNFKKLDVD